MKAKLSTLFSLLLGVFFLYSCSGVEESVTYKVNVPVFMTKSQFRQSVKVNQNAQPIHKQGKMVFYNGYLYISEPEKGIHIIDNRQPNKPQSIGFVELMGNVDLAIKDDFLYADSYIDLVWFDIGKNPAVPELKGRLEDAFPQSLPQTDNNYPSNYYYQKGDENVVIGWKVEETTEVYYRNDGWWGWAEKGDMMTGTTSPGNGGVGKTGSMARFSIYQEYLYTVMNNFLGIFDIKNNSPQKIGDDFYIGWNVETIFSYKDNLFMGTPTGMLIYSVSNPTKPEYCSSLQHIYGCDPVVVENDIAYVTVHSGNNCGQNNNQLIVIDVKNVKSPKALVTYEMTNPKGLGIDNNTLFVCDDGLKIYDASNPHGIMVNQLAHFKDIDGYDLIPFNNVLMMIASDGIYQYDYSNIKDIKQISRIPIFSN
jgi:hypothetical protein